MATIRLEFDPDRVTIGDLVKMEEGIETASDMRNFLIKFVVDEDGNVPGKKKALAMIDKMTVSEITDSIGKLGEMAKDEIVPPTSGGS